MNRAKIKPVVRPKEILLQAAKYIFFFCLMILFAHGKTSLGLAPLCLGLFIGLVFAKQNLLILSPLYILAEITNSCTIPTFVSAIVPVVLLFLVYAIFTKMKKSVNIWILTALTLISTIPYMAFNLTVASPDYLVVFANVVVTVLFAYCAQIACYALLLRGIHTKIAVDEIIGLSAILGAIALALFSNPIVTFNLYYMFVAYAVLFFVYSFSPSIAFLVSVVLGLGGLVGSGEIATLATPVLFATAAIALKPFKRYVEIAGILVVQVLLCLYANIHNFDYLSLISTVIGCLLFVVTPRAFVVKVANELHGLKTNMSTRDLVNQNRYEMSRKLTSVSKLFFNMKSLLSTSQSELEQYNASTLSENIACSFCQNCENYENCFNALGEDTTNVIYPMVKAGLEKGKATILDMPPFITSRCTQIQALSNVINTTSQMALNEIEEIRETMDSKDLLADQFGGVSVMLDDLAKDVKKRISYSTDREKSLGKELARHNIVANEILVYSQSDNLEVTLTLRNADADKAILEKIVSDVLCVKMEKDNAPCFHNRLPEGQSPDFVNVHFKPAPKFNVAFGIAERSKDKNAVSGDSKTIQKLSNGKLMVALCDGMGSGENALSASSSTVALVENFFQAGFGNELVFPLVNKLLTLRKNDDYSTLDLAVVDRQNGKLDIVKMGASDSFLISGENLEIIESSTPPVGILEKITPVTLHYDLRENDILIFVSDGISQVVSNDDIVDMISKSKSNNPQTIADKLLSMAQKRKTNDDATAIAIRLCKTQ